MHYQAQEALWNKDREALRKIRDIVFIQGQQIPQDLEWDDRDLHCWHVLFADETQDSLPIATGRLDTDGKIGRMAVLDEYRDKGIGKLVLHKLIHIARREQIERTFMHAQVQALPFYLKNGFRSIGDVYDKAGIPHQDIEEILEIENLNFSDALNNLLKSIKQSEQSIKLKLQDINHALLCHDDFVSAIRHKAISDQRYKIQIILEKTRPGRRSARFISSYQRLTDKIELKKYIPPKVDADRRQFIIIDRKIVAWQPSVDSSNMRLLRAKDRIKSYSDDFERLFSYSERDISLLKLYL